MSKQKDSRTVSSSRTKSKVAVFQCRFGFCGRITGMDVPSIVRTFTKSGWLHAKRLYGGGGQETDLPTRREVLIFAF